MRWLALLALLPLSFQDPPPAEPAGPLQWKLGKTDFARFDPYKLSFDGGGEEILRANPERLAGIFGYEIVDKTLYRPKPLDKFELPLILGFSLPPKQLKPGQTHEWTVELEEAYDHGPVNAKCIATRVPAAAIEGDTYAKINIEAKLNPSSRESTAPKPPRAVSKGRFEGTLYWDVERGVPQRLDFLYWITLAPADAKGVVETIEQRERIDFLEVLPIRHRKFEGDVNAAIDKGITQVWRHYNAQEGRWGAHYEHATGPTALALLTILKGTMDRKEPRVLKALDWMMAQPLQHTYDVAISLMALEAFYSPADAAARSGQAAAGEKDIAAKMDAGHARWGSSAARWLEINVAQAMWSYPSNDANARDFSNSQYGVLGLYSAARCGFPTNLDVVRRVMESYLRVQRKKGPKVELALQEGEVTSKT